MTFFDNLQWVRGWSFLDQGAHIAYRKVIGAYKKQSNAIVLPFGFRIPLPDTEVRDDSDAFIPGWSQRSNGAIDQRKVQGTQGNGVNHGLMANHPEMTNAYRQIFQFGPDRFRLIP
jgi:hypothetical protein